MKNSYSVKLYDNKNKLIDSGNIYNSLQGALSGALSNDNEVVNTVFHEETLSLFDNELTHYYRVTLK